MTSLGLAPTDAITVEVQGRTSGKQRRTPVILLEHEDHNYVVGLAGESDWVRNVKAADGAALIRRRGVRSVRLVELPVETAPTSSMPT